MNNFKKEYLDYLKDNKEGYWFKRKLYGWGWVPVKWQGWAVVAVFIIYAVLNSLILKPESSGQEITWFTIRLAIGVIILIFVCYKTGEKPRWQWGRIKKDN